MNAGNYSQHEPKSSVFKDTGPVFLLSQAHGSLFRPSPNRAPFHAGEGESYWTRLAHLLQSAPKHRKPQNWAWGRRAPLGPELDSGLLSEMICPHI